MKIGIMQPYFFPYLGYWQLIGAVDKYVVYDDVAYIKGGWISRNNILLEGQKHMITLPLDNPSSFRNINEIAITSNIKQRQKLLRTIEAAYNKADYYPVIMPVIEDLIINCDTIAELNFKTVHFMKKYLELNTEIILSSSLSKDNELKGQDKVIHITKLLGGDTYINAIGGRELYSEDDFRKEGLMLNFLKMGDVKYKQFNDDFVQGLSVIDVLMFNSKENIHEMLKEYSFVR